MKRKEPQATEAEISEKLKEILSKIGFNIQYTDINRRARNPDFLAYKRINGTEYKIAIELKSDSNIRAAIKNGIKILTESASEENYDKLILLLLNNKKHNIVDSITQNFLRDNPTTLEIINLENLENWSKSLSDELSTLENNEVFYYIRQLSKKLIELIAQNSDNLRSLEWRDLERTISELFEGIGFKTTLTPSSKDGGKDVILECTIDKIKKTFIIEIKHWRSSTKVGQQAVKEFTNIIINEKRDKGLFLSTYGFTNNYYESLSEKQKSIIHFGEKEKIVELCKVYEKINNGIWNPVDTLEDILFNGTKNLIK